MRKRLVYDAIALGRAQERRELVVGGIGIERDAEPDALRANRYVLGNPERAPKVEVAFGVQRGVAQLTPSPSRPRARRVTRAASGVSL